MGYVGISRISSPLSIANNHQAYVFGYKVAVSTSSQNKILLF
jgi:hypothetical protein